MLRKEEKKLLRLLAKKKEKKRKEMEGGVVLERSAWGSGKGTSTGVLKYVDGTNMVMMEEKKKRKKKKKKKHVFENDYESGGKRLPPVEQQKNEILSRSSVLGAVSWRKRVDKLMNKYHY